MEPMKPMAPMKPMEPMDFGPKWWPGDLGEPNSSGAQNGLRYAFFSQARRLIIERDGHSETYDSGDHQINGVSQQQSKNQTLAFSSQHGDVNIAQLKKIP